MQALGRPIPARALGGGAGAACRRHHHRRAAPSPSSPSSSSPPRALGGGGAGGAGAACRRHHRRAAPSSLSSPSSPRGVRAAAAASSAADETPTAGRLVDAHLRAEGPFVSYYAEIEIATLRGISLHDLTPLVRRALSESGVSEGTVVVSSQHTTVAVTVNEYEERLMDDARLFLSRLAPAAGPLYFHNDLDRRHAPEGWPGGDDAWRAQEPLNAQAHLQAMLLGASSALPVCRGELKIGRWQSVLGVELDGPRTRRFGVGVTGLRGAGAP